MLKIILKLFRDSGIRKYSANTSWLLAENIVNKVLALLVGVWMARYLGPEDFGILNYVLALTLMFAPFSQLGLKGILVREFVKGQETGTLLMSAWLMKFVGGFMAMGLTVSIMFYVKPDPLYTVLGIVIGSIYLFHSFEVVEYFFLAKIQARQPAIARFLATLGSSAFRIFLIVGGFGLIWFGWAVLANEVFIAMLLVFLFLRSGFNLKTLKFSKSKVLGLIKESWPLVLAEYGAVINMNIDKIMIGEIVNSKGVGLYAAAVSISSVGYFIPVAIVSSLLPPITKLYLQDKKQYLRRLELVFALLMVMAILLAVPVIIFASPIVNLLFGAAYVDSSSVLIVHAISMAFVFLGVARGMWVVTESKTKFQMYSTFSGAAVNVVLNILWLPEYGILGAAYATLCSYFVMYVGAGLFYRDARNITMIQLRALSIVGLYKMVKRNI